MLAPPSRAAYAVLYIITVERELHAGHSRILRTAKDGQSNSLVNLWLDLQTPILRLFHESPKWNPSTTNSNNLAIIDLS